MKASIILFIWILVWDAFGAVKHLQSARETPVLSSRSLRQQVDSYAELLRKEVDSTKKRKEKYRSLNRVLNEIKSLRENSSPQGAFDESHMDLLVSVLESLPQEKKFKKKDCLKYENELLNQFEPHAEEAPEEPAVKPGWDFLRSLCN